MIYCLGTYRWAFVSWEEVVVVFPLFVNACRWIFTGCPQQTAFRTERCASAGKKLKRKSSLHTFKGGWKKKTFCSLFNQYFSWFKHYSQYFTTKHCCTESLCGDIIKVWDVQKHVRRCVSLLINHQMMSVSLESPWLWSFHRTGYIHCFIVYCWCCDHDPGPDCWSCNCFFRLLSSSTRLCTARLRQSASGSPSATSVDVETHYWLFLSVAALAHNPGIFLPQLTILCGRRSFPCKMLYSSMSFTPCKTAFIFKEKQWIQLLMSQWRHGRSCIVQDILTPHLLPRNASSSCAYVCECVCVHPWQNYTMQVLPQTFVHLQESCLLGWI